MTTAYVVVSLIAAAWALIDMFKFEPVVWQYAQHTRAVLVVAVMLTGVFGALAYATLARPALRAVQRELADETQRADQAFGPQNRVDE